MAHKGKNGNPLLVQVSLQPNGSFYALEFDSQDRIRGAFPDAPGLPSVFFGYRKEEEFEPLHRPLWPLAAKLLTGLNEEQVARLGGLRFYDAWTKAVIWEWKTANAKTG